jgi:hypothetical protein
MIRKGLTLESMMTDATVTFTVCATLAAIGSQVRHLRLFEPIRTQV